MKRFLLASLALAVSTVISCNGASTSVEDKLNEAASKSVIEVKSAASPVVDLDKDYYLLGGDILLDKKNPEQALYAESFLKSSSKSVELRGVKKLYTRLWPNGKVPYFFESSVSDSDKAIIRGDFKKWADVSGLTFEEQAADGDYIYTIKKEDGVGGGSSTLGYTAGAMFKYENADWAALHEIGHGIGLAHEHQRPDRDNYISILWDSIGDDMKYAYQKMDTTVEIITPYDYESIMHYNPVSFTIIDTTLPYIGDKTKVSPGKDYLSAGDIESIKFIYPMTTLNSVLEGPRNVNQGESVTFTANVEGATGALQYRWKIGSDSWLSTGNSNTLPLNIDVTFGRGFKIIMEARDANMAMATLTTNVTVADYLDLTMTGPGIVADGERVIYTIDSPNKTGNITSLEWSAMLYIPGKPMEWLSLGNLPLIDVVADKAWGSFLSIKVLVTDENGKQGSTQWTLGIMDMSDNLDAVVTGPEIVKAGEHAVFTCNTSEVTENTRYRWVAQLPNQSFTWYELTPATESNTFEIDMPAGLGNVNIMCETEEYWNRGYSVFNFNVVD